VLKSRILLCISVSHNEGEFDFVGKGEIQMNMHKSFLSLALIQLRIWSLCGVQGITLMFEMVSFRWEKVVFFLHSWMSTTVAVGQHQFLNYVLQNESRHARFILKKHRNSPTKSFTSVNYNDWMTCSDFCTHVQTFYSFLFKTARDSNSSACSALMA